MRGRVLVLGTAFVIASAASSLPARAGGPSDPASIADVVKLKDGSLFRGTILEQVAGDHVLIRLASGEERSFPMGDVVFAGEAGGDAPRERSPSGESLAPRGAGVAPAAYGDRVPLRLEANAPGLEFLDEIGVAEIAAASGAIALRGQATEYAFLCTAPCTTALAAGSHRMALSYRGRRSVPVVDPVDLSGPATLRGTYESKFALRLTGILLATLGTTVGTLIMIGSYKAGTCDGGTCSDARLDTGEFMGGMATAVLSCLVGLPLFFLRDSATIEVVAAPSAPSALLPRAQREGAFVGLPALDGGGLALRARF